jgi:superkiller protein 3
MSFAKGKLRLARDALDKKDYAKAKEAASEVIDYEISNYHA